MQGHSVQGSQWHHHLGLEIGQGVTIQLQPLQPVQSNEPEKVPDHHFHFVTVGLGLPLGTTPTYS